MDKQITLYTSWSGEEKFFEGETFTAFTETVRGHTREFKVSEKHVMQKMNNMRVIDTGSDAEFM